MLIDKTFLFFMASLRLSQFRASLVLDSDDPVPRMKKMRNNEKRRAGIDNIPRTSLQPILVNMKAVNKGVKVNAREGRDWLRPSIWPRFV
jgi:hypothetical protein